MACTAVGCIPGSAMIGAGMRRLRSPRARCESHRRGPLHESHAAQAQCCAGGTHPPAAGLPESRQVTEEAAPLMYAVHTHGAHCCMSACGTDVHYKHLPCLLRIKQGLIWHCDKSSSSKLLGNIPALQGVACSHTILLACSIHRW